MNLVIIKGNLTRDPELRYTPNGTAISNLGVAVNESWTNDQGEKQERVHFFDVDAWGKRAEVIAQYFHKGKPILVQGRLKQESWTDKETGQKRYKVKITMDSFEFCGDTKAGDQRGQGRAEAAQPDASYDAPQEDPNEDAPF
jgi:single-strand DNA-binding protein